MSNFAKGFRRAGTGRIPGCDRVPERPGSAGGKADRVAANGRCKPPYDHDPEP